MASKKEVKFLDLMKKRLKKCIESEDHNRKDALEDLLFLNGEQWDDKVKKERTIDGRPCLQVNLLPKFVDQVTGDSRHSRPRVKVRPVDSKGDIRLAKIREGIIANIEYLSNAESIYDQAMEMAVSCGYGSWRILTRYTEENPFIQEIYLEPINNPFLVYLDPDSKDQFYSDAKYGFILRKISREDFKEEYPKAEIPGDPLNTGQGTTYEHWYDKDSIVVAEYFVKEPNKKIMVQLEDGSVIEKEEAEQLINDYQAKYGAIAELNPDVDTTQFPEEPKIVNEKETEIISIKHYVCTAQEILSANGLDGEKFPGKFIPIILLRGKMRNLEGKSYVRGLIRDAKDPQRMVNYWNSSLAERIALEPKAPWIGTAKQFEGYEQDYAQANIRNFPFLKYNQDGMVPPPTRVGPGNIPPALFVEVQRAEENLKSVIGMFNAQLGDSSPDRTGAALIQRQKPGDVSTYAFHDNLAKAVAFSGRIINEMIPEIYDTERDVRLRNTDETETFVPVNTTLGNAAKNIQANPEMYKGMDIGKLRKSLITNGRDTKLNDMSIGKYDVVITVGPSYATQRQESAQNLLTLVNSMPGQMAVAADLIVENLDFKDSEKLAQRLRKTLPPGIAQPKEGDTPIPPMPPSPEVQLQMEKLKLEQERVALQREKVNLEKVKVAKEMHGLKGSIRSQIEEVISDDINEHMEHKEIKGDS